MEKLSEILKRKYDSILYFSKNWTMEKITEKLYQDQIIWLSFLKKTQLENTNQFFAWCEIRKDTINGYLLEILDTELRKVRFIYPINQKNA